MTRAATTHQPHKQVLIKFALLSVLLVAYFAYLSWQFDVLTGGIAAALTWSFFVICTPIADAGFLLDFPLRLLFGIRMVISEIAVWLIALLINVCALALAADYYQTTLLTRLLYQIITTPFPYWAVVALSAAGTFLSIRFGEELMDVIHHRDRAYFHSHHFKHELILFVVFILVLFAYYELISSLGISHTI